MRRPGHSGAALAWRVFRPTGGRGGAGAFTADTAAGVPDGSDHLGPALSPGSRSRRDRTVDGRADDGRRSACGAWSRLRGAVTNPGRAAGSQTRATGLRCVRGAVRVLAAGGHPGRRVTTAPA